MQNFILALHSLLRWAVLLTALYAIMKAYSGWFGKKLYTSSDNKSSLFFMIAADLQFLVGLLLYFFSANGFKKISERGMAEVMKDPVDRFWAVEHISMMVIAWILIHIGRSSSKKAGSDIGKHKRAAIYFTIALLLILAAIPWPFMQNARPYFRPF